MREYDILTGVEFFSGIGGFHCAALLYNLLIQKKILYKHNIQHPNHQDIWKKEDVITEKGNKKIEIVRAYDINPIANSIYKKNFKSTILCEKAVENISVEELDTLHADIFFLSSPCQPYTRIGLQRDINDNRANSLLYILKLLENMSYIPTYIVLENVHQFEYSDAYKLLLQTLYKQNYTVEAFLLSPRQFGIPNQRTRFFLLATIGGSGGNSNTNTPIILKKIPRKNIQREESKENTSKNTADNRGDKSKNIADNREDKSKNTTDNKENNSKNIADNKEDKSKNTTDDKEIELSNNYTWLDVIDENMQVPSLFHSGFQTNTLHFLACYCCKEFVDIDSITIPNDYIIPITMAKHIQHVDIVKSTSINTMCFTKAYGKYFHASGSILLDDINGKDIDIDENIDLQDITSLLINKQQRYFTEYEIAALHMFPPSLESCKRSKISCRHLMHFTFPAEIFWRKRLAVLGNSLNVYVVALLLLHLIPYSH